MSSGRIPSVEGGIQPTIVDAKGDLIVATAADTVSRLAVGSNDQVLTADSSTATGLKWATPAAGGMTLLSTTTLSGASTTVSSISGDYQNLLIVVYGATNNTANNALRLSPNNANSCQAVSIINAPGDSLVEVQAVANNESLRVSTLAQSRTDANNVYVYEIANYANSTYYKAINFYGFFNSASGRVGFSGGGGFFSNTAISSLVFSNSGGTFSAGTVLVYGVK